MCCMPIQSEDPTYLPLESGFNVVMTMPTGSGKTWRASQAIKRCVETRKKAVYVSPTRALASELHARWSAEWPAVQCGIFTGDHIHEHQSAKCVSSDVLVVTPEKLDLITRQWRHHWHWLPQVDLVVFDEIHLLADRNRGARLEAVIFRLRSLNPFARVICLSATIGNPEELARWLDGVCVKGMHRTIPLTWSTRIYSKADDKPRILMECLAPVISEGGKSIVFVQSKRRAEQLTEQLVSAGLKAQYHHAGLQLDRRAEVETGFRDRSFDVLVATATLEVGLNLPARQVVLYDLQQFQEGEFRPLSVISAWQRAGRAGRPGMDDRGEVIVMRARWEPDKRYEVGKFEPVVSGLSSATDLAEQVVISVAAGFARSRLELDSILARSLCANQGRLPPLEPFVTLLVDAGFLAEVEVRGELRLRATNMGRICTRLMVSPECVLRIRGLLTTSVHWTYFDLLLLASVAGDRDSLLSVDYEELEGLAALINSHRSAWLPQLLDSGLDGIAACGISPRGMLSGLKAASALSTWTSTGSVEEVARQHHTYPGEIRRLQESCLRTLSTVIALIDLPSADEQGSDGSLCCPVPATTRDWLSKKVRRLTMMVEAGLDHSAVSLTLVSGIGKSWALRLVDAGIHDLEELAQSDPEQLVLLGRISTKRATQWIQEAASLLSSETLYAHQESETRARVCPGSQELDLEVYRLKRSWSLTVKPLDIPDTFLVTGGLDPHRVSLSGGKKSCDCFDFAKGHVCKHLIAVRRQLADFDVLQADEALRSSSQGSTFNLSSLWSR
jgi:helicase